MFWNLLIVGTKVSLKNVNYMFGKLMMLGKQHHVRQDRCHSNFSYTLQVDSRKSLIRRLYYHGVYESYPTDQFY